MLWEGGVRVNAFVSGGALPAAARGQRRDGYIMTADLHATICALAGVPIADPMPVAGVPGVDGLDMWGYIVTGQSVGRAALAPPFAPSASPRDEVMLACLGNSTVVPADAGTERARAWTGGALITGQYKLIYGWQMGMGFHMGVLPTAFP